MLDAYLRKGAQLPTERRPDLGRRVIEDAITSTLFTSVRFMSPLHVSQVLSLLFDAEVQIPLTCDVTLWRRFPAASGDDNVREVEPDIVFDLHYVDHIARSVIEIKWDDVLRFGQVRAQVGSARVGLERTDALRHLSIVKFADLEVYRFEGTKLRQWTSILSDMKRAGSEKTESSEKVFIEWCRDAALLLERLGIGTFKGFGDLVMQPVARHAPVPLLRQFAWADLKAVRERK
jgi:hypothetical protein